MKKILKDTDLKDMASAIISQSLLGILNSQIRIQSQCDLLEASQGGQYAAFVSGEVNRSHANLIASQKPLLDLLKIITDKGGDKILINNITNAGGDVKAMDTDAAVILIQKEVKTMMDDPFLIAAKAGQLQLEDVPDVCARNQNLREIGIKQAEKPKLAIPLETSPKDHHENRKGNRDKGEMLVDIDEEQYRG